MPTILVVDDDPTVLQVAELSLRRGGYTVMRASSGLEALMLYSSYSERLDAVLTDVDMPGMNGIDLASRIHANHPDARILLMTGCLPEGVQAPAGYRLILKPFRAQDLLAALAGLLGG